MLQKELYSKNQVIKLSVNQERSLNLHKQIKIKHYGVEFIVAFDENETPRAYYQGQEVIDLIVKPFWF